MDSSTSGRLGVAFGRNDGWPGEGVEEFEALFDEDFAEGGSDDVVVSLEAVVIDFGEDVAEGVIGEAEEEVVPAVHLAFEIVADVGQGLAGDG